MRTDELIARLAGELTPIRGDQVRRSLGAAVAIGAAASGVALVLWLGLRPLVPAMAEQAFWLKAAYALAVAAGGWIMASRLARPHGRVGRGFYVLAAAFVVLAAIGTAQLAAADPQLRARLLFGETWTVCPWRILALSTPMLAALCLAMRGLAPTRPGLAGCAAGLLAGGVAATIYGLHCQEASPAFVATWYTLGVAMSAALGAVVSLRLMRW